MSPTILSVAFPFAPVTDDPVGGAEQILSALDRAVVARGWRSLVLACEGSRTAGELIPVAAPEGPIDDLARARVHAQVRATLAELLQRERIDLVHLHGLDYERYLPPPGPPVLATLHLPMDHYDEASLSPRRPGTWLAPVSQDQARRAPPSARLLDPIPLGVDVDAFPRMEKPGYALILGRICPEKGVHLALDAAKRAGLPLLVAGAVFPYEAHQRYFQEELKPRFDRLRLWVGPVTGLRKRRLIAAASCLVVPSLVHETACLAAMEALAAGTPVVAYPNGALPQAIEPGVTGFLVEDIEAMARAMRQARTLDPEACRAAARARFPLKRMTDAYLDLYARLTAASEDDACAGACP